MKKTGKYNTVTWIPVAVIIVLVLLYSTGITQMQKYSAGNSRESVAADTTIQDNDSVEVIGTPVNDDPWAELEKIVTAYYSKTGIKYTGTVKAIDDNNEQEKVLEEMTFEYSILGNSYHYKLGNIECVNKETSILMVDHTGKTIAWSSGLVYSKEKAHKLFDIEAFRQIMLQQKANARVTGLNQEKILTIDRINDPAIQGYRIHYDPQTYRIHKMLMGMARLSPLEETVQEEETTDNNETPGMETGEESITGYYYYLEVNFTSSENLSLRIQQFKPENKFIKIVNNKIEIVPAYSSYTLLNAGE